MAGRNRVNLVVLGAGAIGRALLGQITARQEALRERLGIDLQVGTVATSRLWRGAGSGPLEGDQPRAIAATGLEGDLARPYTPYEMRAYLGSLTEPTVVVDVTAAETGDLLLAALMAGHHVVLANKKPVSGQAAIFAAFMRYRAEGRVVRYEATVGAGLPVISTLQDMVETGDRIVAIDAALSGTLGYLCTALQDGAPFSRAVRSARANGYTEPDPRDDLSGRDVARKAVILARTCGFEADLDALPAAGLGDLGSPEAIVEQFMASLEGQDEAMTERVAHAGERGEVLRYVARVTPEGASTGLQSLSREHPLASLRGTANLVAITSERYRELPLVVSGHGAGAAVTAAGVFGDVLAAARVARGG